MTLVQRTINIVEHFEELFKNKFFKTVFISIFVAFFSFTTFNAYAQSDSLDGVQLENLIDFRFTTEGSWKGEKKKNNALQDVDLDDESIMTTKGHDFLSTVHELMGLLCIDCFVNAEEVVQNEDIPDSMKIGLIDMVDDGVTAMLYNPPSVDIPSHLAQEWVPGYDVTNTSLYAADSHPSGYEELQMAGVDVLWGRVRNIAYLMFVIVMIVIGFMIMFRSKIGGQTMVTIGNAIPNIIISLVLVTFSFAIAGFIIDIGGLVLMFIASILGGGDVNYDQFTTIANPLKVTWIAFSGKGNLTATTMGLATTIGTVVAGIAFAGNLASIDLKITDLATMGVEKIDDVLRAGGKAAIVGGVAVGIVWLAVIGIVGYGAIKLWFMLLKSYLTILIQVIAAPIIIMTAGLPGNMKAFGNWAKGIARNVLVFPVTFALINLPAALYGISDSITLRLPGKLIFQDPAEYSAKGTGLGGQLFIAILEVILIYTASQVPAFLETILPSNSSPAAQKAGDKTKEALSKMPLVGSVFK